MSEAAILRSADIEPSFTPTRQDCSASISARAGWRGTCSPERHGLSIATGRSSTSSTRMFKPARQMAKGHHAVSGAADFPELPARIHVWEQGHKALPTRISASSTTSSARKPALSACTCRPTPKAVIRVTYDQRQSFGSPTNSRAVRQDNCFRRPAGERVTSREGLAATRSGQHSVAPVLPVPLLQRAAQAAILTTHSDVSSTISSANSHGSWVRNDRGCLRGRSRDLGDPRVPARHREHQVPARGTASRSG